MQLTIRASIVPLLQAFLTSAATIIGVLLVLHQKRRLRVIPFYSDASQIEPSRVILCSLENLAWFFTPFTALLEYLYHLRLLQEKVRTVPKALPLQTALSTLLNFQKVPSIRGFVKLYFCCGLAISFAFFITTNVPSRPQIYKITHQLAASALLTMYAIQSTVKIFLADAFDNYCVPSAAYRKVSRAYYFWVCWHRIIRRTIAALLWILQFVIFIGYFGRVFLARLETGNVVAREILVRAMAFSLYIATVTCVIYMVIVASDLRNMKVTIHTQSVDNESSFDSRNDDLDLEF